MDLIILVMLPDISIDFKIINWVNALVPAFIEIVIKVASISLVGSMCPCLRVIRCWRVWRGYWSGHLEAANYQPGDLSYINSGANTRLSMPRKRSGMSVKIEEFQQVGINSGET